MLFYGLILEITVTSDMYLLKLHNEVQAIFKGKGISLHLLKGGVSKILWRHFKTTIEGCLGGSNGSASALHWACSSVGSLFLP